MESSDAVKFLLCICGLAGDLLRAPLDSVPLLLVFVAVEVA